MKVKILKPNIPTEGSRYSVTHIDDKITFVEVKPNAKIADSLPLYPVTIYVTEDGEIVRIELLWQQKDWPPQDITPPDSCEASRLQIKERGESHEEMTIKGDSSIFFDLEQDILMIDFGVRGRHTRDLDLGKEVIASVVGEQLKCLYFINWSQH